MEKWEDSGYLEVKLTEMAHGLVLGFEEGAWFVFLAVLGFWAHLLTV